MSSVDLWVCSDCLFASEYAEVREIPDGEPKPWALWENEDTRYAVAGTDCDTPDHWQTDPDAHSEQCSTLDFATMPCGACGSHLAGTRHAFSILDH